MLSKMDKAWIAGMVGFICMQVTHFFGWVIDPSIQAGIVGAILFVLTYVTPNKTPS